MRTTPVSAANTSVLSGPAMSEPVWKCPLGQPKLIGARWRVVHPKPWEMARYFSGHPNWPLPPPAKVVEAPPAPIPLKFYGFINPLKSGTKRAFFLDGEDIIVASEGQLIKNRYKIVRIGVNSAVVEDTQAKNNQQTLPLVEEQTG